MNDEKWSWWVGDGERYHTECDTREKAVKVAKDYGGATIIEATKPVNIKMSAYINVENLIEQAEEWAQDDHGDPEGSDLIFEISNEDEADLAARIVATIDKWQEDRGLVFTGWLFGATRNQEYIPDPEETPAHD